MKDTLKKHRLELFENGVCPQMNGHASTGKMMINTETSLSNYRVIIPWPYVLFQVRELLYLIQINR